jgi:hypothetical protein
VAIGVPVGEVFAAANVGVACMALRMVLRKGGGGRGGAQGELTDDDNCEHLCQ